MITRAYIRYSEVFLPAKTLLNADISKLHPSWSSESIFNKIGIDQRHICGENESTSDMAIGAINKLFSSRINIKKEDIDFIILCTQTPDFEIPTNACYLQHAVGLNTNVGAYDFNLGCSGFVYGLSMAKGLIESGQARNVLFVTSEAYSKRIHPADYKNMSIFGDAATASIISSEKGSSNELSGEILSFKFGSNGKDFDKLIHFSSGTCLSGKNEKYNISYNESSFGDDYLYMDGTAIFNFTLSVIPGLIEQTLTNNSFNADDIDIYVMHQANQFMLEAIRKKAKLPQEKFYISMKNVGNTVSCTIPIAMKNAIAEQKIKSGSKVLLAGFGVGLSMAGCVISY
jgi:3-oxoacyl-[acyl-carrier-protein] synthase III